MSTEGQLAARNSLGMRLLRSGPTGLVRVLNEILLAFDRVRVGSSPDIVVVEEGGRPRLRFANPDLGKTTRMPQPPFQPIPTVDGSGNARWELEPGLVTPNNRVSSAALTPTIDGTPMTATPRPQITPHPTLATLIYLDVRGSVPIDGSSITITQCTIETTTGAIPASSGTVSAFECRQAICSLPPLSQPSANPNRFMLGNQILDVWSFIPYLVSA